MAGSTWPAPIRYAGGHLDRAGERRQDEAWVAQMLAHPDARVTVLWRDRSLVRGVGGPSPTAALLAASEYRAVAPVVGEPWTLLGVDDRGPVFAADASTPDESDQAAEHVVEQVTAHVAANVPGSAGDAVFIELPRIATLLGVEDASLLAYARGMLFWQRRARFCGVCGAATDSRHAGHMRRCTNAACGTETYPRTDPAVIMLVERPATPSAPRRCLLGRHTRLPSRMFSTLAGFVEPGETLEETVARELFEEAGVRVSAVMYQGSQPWPFPASLMIAFRAVADDDALLLDPHELDEAGWFSAADLSAFGESGDATAARVLPGRASIARALIEAWLAEEPGA